MFPDPERLATIKEKYGPRIAGVLTRDGLKNLIEDLVTDQFARNDLYEAILHKRWKLRGRVRLRRRPECLRKTES